MRTYKRLITGLALSMGILTFQSCEKSYDAFQDNSQVGELSEVSVLMPGKDNGAIIPNHYIVVFNNTAGARLHPGMDYASRMGIIREEVEQVASAYAIDRGKIEHMYGATIQGFSVELTEAQLNQLRADRRVAYIEPDRMFSLGNVTTQARPGGGGGSTGQTTPWGITRVGGPVNYTGTNVAWILDSGIDLTHSDLNVNASRGFNAFTSGRDARNLNDDNGHGTHVAGTVAAINNTLV